MPQRPSRRTFLKGLAGAAAATPIVGPPRHRPNAGHREVHDVVVGGEGAKRRLARGRQEVPRRPEGHPYPGGGLPLLRVLPAGHDPARGRPSRRRRALVLRRARDPPHQDRRARPRRRRRPKLGIQDKLDKTVHQFVTSGGKLYGLLGVNVPYALIYNRDLYQAAGVAKAPTSQEEYIQVAKRLTKRPDQFGHAARTHDAGAERLVAGHLPLGAGLRRPVGEGQEAPAHRGAGHQRGEGVQAPLRRRRCRRAPTPRPTGAWPGKARSPSTSTTPRTSTS